MAVCWGIFMLGLVGFAVPFIWKLRVVVPLHHVGWDGEKLYPAGTYWHPWTVRIVDLAPQITTFGVDVLGTVSLVSTLRDESGTSYTKSGPVHYASTIRETVRTQQREHFAHRYVMAWQPDKTRVHLYLNNSGAIHQKLCELLRTVPDLQLKRYQHLMGIKMLWMDKVMPGDKHSSVSLGEGIEVPY